MGLALSRHKLVSRRDQQELTRSRLLEAAEELILEQSIPGLSLRAVCSRAGFTQGAFYSNFKDKNDLLLRVMERHMQFERRSLEQALSDVTDLGLTQALPVIAGWLDGISAKQEWARIDTEIRLQALRDKDFAACLALSDARINTMFAHAIVGLARRFELKPALSPDTIATTLLSLWRAINLRKASSADGTDERKVFLTVLCSLLGADVDASQIDAALAAASSHTKGRP